MDIYPECGKYSDKFVHKFLYWMQVGKNAMGKICNYNDFLVTQMHPDPPVDSESDTRYDGILLRQNKNNFHPDSINTTSIYNMNNVKRNGLYGDCLNAFQRNYH